MAEPENAGQRVIKMTDLDYPPMTVHDHTEHPDGMTLHTIDPDSDNDLEIYDDERDAHLSGNPPEEQ